MFAWCLVLYSLLNYFFCCWYFCSLKYNKMGWFVQQQNLHNMINVLENRGCLRILHMQIKEASMKQQETFQASSQQLHLKNNRNKKIKSFRKNRWIWQKNGAEWKLIAKTYYWLIYYTLYTKKKLYNLPFS